MLSDNIKKYRKEKNLSQDELAEQLGVSRQSISLWETGQTQPTIENIIALATVFGISTDSLLGSTVSIKGQQEKGEEKMKANKGTIIAITAAALVVICAGIAVSRLGNHTNVVEKVDVEQESVAVSTIPNAAETQDEAKEADIFELCKAFAIEKGELNGDYCSYQQPAETYGGYPDEFFSVSYWADSDMVEFCLHCPLSETQSINFFLRMRGGYDHQYEYAVSKYLRDSGKSIRFAMGMIDPTVFSDSYPLPCEQYYGDMDGQNEFMEESRVGICDLIHCLKNFTESESVGCAFSDFEFTNFS